jgi:outer membrane cobalamin receptor
MKQYALTLFLILAILTANSQQRFTISGIVTDGTSSESLIGATVYEFKSLAGTSTNLYGFYSITLPRGEVSINFSFIGYESKLINLELQRDTVISVSLIPGHLLDEITINASKTARKYESTQTSAMSLQMNEVKSLPTFLGETDLMKALQLTPGVQSGNEGTGGIYVRGGGPDQNLILLDGVPVYNASHLFGFFSVFNADAVKSMELIKGGFPARYGGRSSSVVDIRMKEGNMNKFGGEGAIGLISSRLTLEGPLVKDKSSFIVSGRRTYLDLLARPIIKKSTGGDEDIGYYFYDLNMKVNYKISDNDRIYFSAYMGDDRFYAISKYKSQSFTEKSKGGIDWGNITAAARWNRIFSNKLFSNTTLTYSKYNFNTVFEEELQYKNPPTKEYSGMVYKSGIKDWALRVDFDYVPLPDHYIKFGGSAIHHTFSPGALGLKSIELKDTTLGARDIVAGEFNLYIEDDIKVNSNLKINAGIHLSAFNVRGKTYTRIEPRLAARQIIGPELSLKASYSRMNQYIHLLTNSGISLPTDLWVPSTNILKPQSSDQVSLGIFKDYKGEYEFSAEAYYKKMQNVMEYKEGSGFFNINSEWENKITQGEGQSYGIELLARRNVGKLTGWVGYTLSKTERRFDDINQGKPFPYKYDRRHDIGSVLMYKPNTRREYSATWVYGTGNAITLPIAQYRTSPTIDFAGYYYATAYSERNAYRMNSYHRLDVSASFIKQKKWGERRWVIGAYNAYSRSNPFYVDIVWAEERIVNNEHQYRTKFVQYSLFPIIPSVSYQFKF